MGNIYFISNEKQQTNQFCLLKIPQHNIELMTVVIFFYEKKPEQLRHMDSISLEDPQSLLVDNLCIKLWRKPSEM